VVHGPFLFLSLKGRGRQLEGVGEFFVGGGPVLGGQGSGQTHDVTGPYGCLEIGNPRSGLLFLGVGEVRELRGDVMELLPEVLVFLGDCCDSLGYPAQLV